MDSVEDPDPMKKHIQPTMNSKPIQRDMTLVRIMATPNKMFPMRAITTDTKITIPNIPACLGFIND